MRSDPARNMNADRADLAFPVGWIGSALLALQLRPKAPAAPPTADPTPHARSARAIRPARTPNTPQSRISASSIIRTKSTGPSRPPFAFVQAAQIEDRIAHQLPRPVIRHIAAAIDLVQRHAHAAPACSSEASTLARLRIASQRQHRRMLQQQQHVLDAALQAAAPQAPPAAAAPRRTPPGRDRGTESSLP